MRKFKIWGITIGAVCVGIAVGITVSLMAQMEPEDDEQDCEWYLDWKPGEALTSGNESLNVNAFFWTNCGDIYHFTRDFYVFGEDNTVSITVQKILP